MAGCDKDVAAQEEQPKPGKGMIEMHDLYLGGKFLHPCRFEVLINEDVCNTKGKET